MNLKGPIRPRKTSRELRCGTHLDYLLSCFSVSDQNVNSIACKFRAPPGLDVGVKHGEQFRGGLLPCLPRQAGEPGQEQGGGGRTSLEGQEQFSDLFEIGFVFCQVVTCGHTGGHDKNELKKENSVPAQNTSVCCQKTHVVDLGEWVDSAILTIVPPLVSLVDDILQ